MIVPVEKVEAHLFHFLSDYNKAMRKGVKIRLVTQKSGVESTPRKPKALEENVLFEFKYLSDLVPFGARWYVMHIIDKKEMTLCVSKEAPVPSLWSNNPQLLKLSTNYFDDLWNSSCNDHNSQRLKQEA
jgi:hypothetical protein